MKIDVLDHGFVRLVSYTQPVPEEVTEQAGYGTYFTRLCQPMPGGYGTWTGDLEIVRAARVSYNADWRPELEESSPKAKTQMPKDEKLIHYLMRNRHTSPFEAMDFTFEIKCPIFIARQWHRHRTWSYNEVSARYTELPEEFYVPDPKHIGTQGKGNKQVRDLGITTGVAENHSYVMRTAGEAAFSIYQILLEQGCPRELARSVLPLSTYTRFFGKVDLHNLFHFIGLRLHAHAQYEIQVYAQALLSLITPICPVSVAAFKKVNITEP